MNKNYMRPLVLGLLLSVPIYRLARALENFSDPIHPEPGALARPEPPEGGWADCFYPPTKEIRAESEAEAYAALASMQFLRSCCVDGLVSEVLSPETLQARDPFDPWGTEYMLRCKKKVIQVVSAGPDGLWGTSDDRRGEFVRVDHIVNHACGSPGPFTPAAAEELVSQDEPAEPPAPAQEPRCAQP